jgi:hypothetical protein
MMAILKMTAAAVLEEHPTDVKTFVEEHSGALTIMVLCALVLGTLLVLVPQLLRAHNRTMEMEHLERMKTLEKGEMLVHSDDRSLAAARMAMLVPIVSICAAATVTCFLVAYHSEHLFAVTLASWCVAGVVGLAAITGGVALIGRLAQLDSEEEEQEEKLPVNPQEK